MPPEFRIVETPGGTFAVLPTDTIISRSIVKSGFFERHIAEIAKNILARSRAVPGGTGGHAGPGAVVDIGANIGTFAIPVARASGCRLLCFEPQRVISELLARNFVLNDIANGEVFRCALGDSTEQTEIELPAVDYEVEGNFGALSVDRDIFNSQSLARLSVKPGEATEKCRLARLDDFAFTGVALVKIDVEGFEEKVLRGGVMTLEENRFPPLIFEAWRDDWYRARRESLLAFVEDLGYDVTQMDENFLAQHRARPAEERVEVRMKPAPLAGAK